MKVVLQPHLKIRLKQRLIPQTYPKKIIAEADSQYYYSLSQKLKVEGGKNMKKTNQAIYYDKKTDFLWFLIKSGPEETHQEISPGVSVELNKKGEVLGIEILNASKVLGSKLGLKIPTKNISYAHKIEP